MQLLRMNKSYNYVRSEARTYVKESKRKVVICIKMPDFYTQTSPYAYLIVITYLYYVIK